MKPDQQSLSWKNVIKIAGVWISYCIGSGFATGQDMMQYFVAYGTKGFIGIFIGIAIHIYVTTSYMSLGKDREFENPMSVFDYFCGRYLGKIVAALTVVYALFGPSVMVSGFGATISQLTGVSATVGSIIMGVVVTATVLLGLQKMADIIGTIGPVLIIVSLVTGGLYLIGNWERIKSGAMQAEEMELLSIGDNWFMGGVYFATWAPLMAAPFLTTTAKTINTKKEGIVGMIVGNLGYLLACFIMVAAFFCDIGGVSKVQIPTLYLAQQMSPFLTVAFIGVIILGIYSSAVPGMFTFVSTFAKEKTKRYYIISICTGFFITIVTMLIPFDALMNLLFSVYGALGLPFIFLIAFQQIRGKVMKSKGAESESK